MNFYTVRRIGLRCILYLAIQIPLISFALEHKPIPQNPTELDSHSVAQLVKTCTGCHGPKGKSTPYGYFPRIAGKPEAYLFNQLINFQQGSRVNPQMSYLLENISPSYLHLLAIYFATQEVPYPAPAKVLVNAAELELGRSIVQSGLTYRGIPACANCHAATLTGVAPSIPGLLGLPRDYLIAQLGAWRTHQRHAQNPDCMAQIANKLRVEEISAVTAWLSTQPWPKDGRPLSLTSLAQPLALECGSVSTKSLNVITATTSTPPVKTSTPTLNALQLKGEYLMRIGNCLACHTPNSAEFMVGGRAVETPYGQVFSSNLTPDPQTGLSQRKTR